MNNTNSPGRKRARSNPPGELRGGPPKQTAHRVQLLLGLVATRMGLAKCEVRGVVAPDAKCEVAQGQKGKICTKAKGRKSSEREGECKKVAAICGGLLY